METGRETTKRCQSRSTSGHALPRFDYTVHLPRISPFFFFLPLDEFYPLDATIFAKFHHQRRGLYLDYIWSAIDICHDGLESGLGFIVIRSLLLELLLLRRVNTIVPNGIYSRIFYPWTDKRKFHQQDDYI